MYSNAEVNDKNRPCELALIRAWKSTPLFLLLIITFFTSTILTMIFVLLQNGAIINMRIICTVLMTVTTMHTIKSQSRKCLFIKAVHSVYYAGTAVSFWPLFMCNETSLMFEKHQSFRCLNFRCLTLEQDPMTCILPGRYSIYIYSVIQYISWFMAVHLA